MAAKRVNEAKDNDTWYRDHYLENHVIEARNGMYPFQHSDIVADPAGFWVSMMRQAKALQKFIRESALRDGCDPHAKRGRDGRYYTKRHVYDRKTKSYVLNPVFQGELREKMEREDAAKARRAQFKLVELEQD